MSKKDNRGKQPPPPKSGAKPKVPGAPKVEPFPLKPSQMIVNGIEGFRRAPLPLAFGTALPFLVSLPMLIAGEARLSSVDEFSFSDSDALGGMALYVLGVVIAGAASYPVCDYALRASRGQEIELAAPFRDRGRFLAMFNASFWFWAGILLGLSLFVLPAVFVLVFYVFYGFILVDRPDLGGSKALGTSVRIGDKRRIAMFGLAVLFGALVFFCYLLPVAFFGLTLITAVLVYLLLVVGVAVSLVSWASLYDVLRKDLPDAW